MGEGPHMSEWILSPNFFALGLWHSFLMDFQVAFAYLQELQCWISKAESISIPLIAPLLTICLAVSGAM